MARNHNRLIENKHLYPFCDILSVLYSNSESNDSKHENFVNAFPEIQSIGHSKNYLEPHNALAFKMLQDNSGAKIPPWHPNLPERSQDMFKLIHSQINYHSPKTVHIISEVLSNLGANDCTMIDQIYQEFSYCNPNLFVILRRPDEYLSSWYRQELCFGYPRMGSIRERFRNIYRNSIHFDYQKLLFRWIDKNPSNQISIARYDKIRNQDGSLNWYLNCSEVIDNLLLSNHESGRNWANPSLHPAFINLARKANTQLPLHKALRVISCLKDLSQHSSLPPANDVELFGKEFRMLLIREFKPIDCYLGSLFGKTRFFEDLDEMVHLKKIPLIEAEQNVSGFLHETLLSSLDQEQSAIVELWIKNIEKKGRP